jgi:molecular chaperone GrpE
MTDPTPSKPNPAGPALPPQLAHLAQLKRRKKYRLRRKSYSGPLPGMAGAEGGESAQGGAEIETLRDQIARLEADLKSAQEEAREAAERVLRTRADMENQRRRHMKEKEDLRKFATEDLMSNLVSPMDHFELALQSLDSTSTVDSIRQGVVMIHRELLGVLGSAGLRGIEPLGKPFDPNEHEAVATGTDTAQPDGVVLALMRPGWSLNGRVLRPAMVKVNKVDEAASGGD